jgi:hypothetical protein
VFVIEGQPIPAGYAVVGRLEGMLRPVDNDGKHTKPERMVILMLQLQ